MLVLSIFILALIMCADLSRTIDDHREARQHNKNYFFHGFYF